MANLDVAYIVGPLRDLPLPGVGEITTLIGEDLRFPRDGAHRSVSSASRITRRRFVRRASHRMYIGLGNLYCGS